MSTFPDTVADCRRLGRGPEKSNFTQTCNLLSQFLKEKRSSGALSLGMAGKMEPRATTMDLLTNLESSDDTSRENASALDFVPQFLENPCIKQSDFRSPARSDPKTPQMAIFYAGKVLVFDAFLPEKATEIMELATKLSSNNSGFSRNPLSVPENLNAVKVPQTNTTREAPRPGSEAFGSDMKYPRRASLLKFLEKRKERVLARGPYQMNPKNEGDSSGGNPEDQFCKPFDLNL